MKKILGFDTETTGFPDMSLPPLDNNQPWPVQIGARMVDETGALQSELNFLIAPPIAINPEAIKVHGITDERAAFYGFKPITGISMLFAMIAKADVIVGHNLGFDINIVNLAKHRLCIEHERDPFDGKEHFDTQVRSAGILQLPATDAMILANRGHQYKSPKLSEAYRYFFDREIANAHDAMVDVKASLEIYFHIKKLEELATHV